jgi:dipeptide/tripeptide permease
MPEGWWVSLTLTGLSLSIGLLVYILRRDHVRRERQEAERDSCNRVVQRSSSRNTPTVKELEKQYGKKG